MTLPEPVAATIHVTEVLERLKIPYLIGGSLASTVHGLVRTTQDTDLLADLREANVGDFVKALLPQFFLDEQAVLSAVKKQGSFNLIDRSSFFRVDIFILGNRTFDKTQIGRAVSQTINTDPHAEAKIATAEDTLLAKLDWYKRGNETSERQWQDVLGILRVQADRLDNDYLGKWAAELGVSGLLERARKELANL